MKILVTGSRYWTEQEHFDYIDMVLTGIVTQYLLSSPIAKSIDVCLIHGDCVGVDKQAAKVAEKLGLDIKSYPADWKKYGKGAGIIRNQRMLDLEEPDIVIAFHNNLAKSKGTKHMVNYARDNGYKVIVFEGLEDY